VQGNYAQLKPFEF